jgi:hypothetical protein
VPILAEGRGPAQELSAKLVIADNVINIGRGIANQNRESPPSRSAV